MFAVDLEILCDRGNGRKSRSPYAALMFILDKIDYRNPGGSEAFLIMTDDISGKGLAMELRSHQLNDNYLADNDGEIPSYEEKG